MGQPIYNYNFDFFYKDSEELYYYLGFIASDGYITDERIEICLNIKDEKIVRRFRDLICPNKPIYFKKSNNSCSFTIFSKVLCKKVKKFFYMYSNNKAKEIRFPYTIPEAYIKDFIRGYIDGDGCIDRTKGYKEGKVYVGPRLRILGNYYFLDVLNMATKLFYKHNTNKVSRKGKENIYYLTYNFSTAKALLDWIYRDSNISLERKYVKAKELANF